MTEPRVLYGRLAFPQAAVEFYPQADGRGPLHPRHHPQLLGDERRLKVLGDDGQGVAGAIKDLLAEQRGKKKELCNKWIWRKLRIILFKSTLWLGVGRVKM